ncbi:IBR domain, Zinc finger, RING/FYVE/PHD-type, E3 ubiquitin ligase RBR family [Artemisia annua]|uniref:RBR-type E3 ubiquitin transferase n=1 Tax=Artemisia annua TaxID=35608 RepID=A0A2U1P0J5_ARTAN|nr:IBR domain, Zinc finger, RING/FYVE/PHD-type, E3 ubiquitin ligase RBR family [Artemisia annua]
MGSAAFCSTLFKYINKKKKNKHSNPPTHLHVLEQPDNDETRVEEDAMYAQQLQLQEALLASSSSASMLDSQTLTNNVASFFNNKIEKQTCRICLEMQDYWKMFKNPTCSHSFCNDCTSKHATTKVQEKVINITCPEPNCNSTLDFNTLRLIIPKDILIKWDDVLCESIIPESDKFYCPFPNCSTLLIKDDKSIRKTNCPVCKRSLCALCRVPWHSNLTCNEFKKLDISKKADEMAIAFAKKNKWKQCPNCNFFVEKAAGCSHITCRCKYHFCYNCGQEWASTLGCCKPARSQSN